jgi:hypothetical protein
MTQIEQTGTLELLPEELDKIAGGMSVPTNEATIIADIQAKNLKDGSIFTGRSSYHDTLDNNDNLP